MIVRVVAVWSATVNCPDATDGHVGDGSTVDGVEETLVCTLLADSNDAPSTPRWCFSNGKRYIKPRPQKDQYIGGRFLLAGYAIVIQSSLPTGPVSTGGLRQQAAENRDGNLRTQKEQVLLAG